jgi:tetratricopeptide (TPR) repeat protein
LRKTIIILSLLIASVTVSISAKTGTAVDSMEVLKQYSLFTEYHKNHDYTSALPYGWQVIEMNPKMFSKWIYTKMEEIYWYQHDSADVSPEELQAINDTIIYLYDLAIEHHPEEKGYWQSKKAYVTEAWLQKSTDETIVEYEKAIEIDPNLSTYYYHRLGTLYMVKAEEDEAYKEKALDIFSYLAEKEPENPQWPSILEGLVDNIDELVALTKKAWELDRENLAKAYKYGDMALRANSFQDAIEAFQFLTAKSADNINYWTKLGTAYQKTDQTNKAEEVYGKLIKLEPDNRNHYLNLGIIYKDKGQLTQARNMFIKASDVGGGWGLPIYYEGLLYEQAARNCGAHDFEAKLVYQVAQDTYRRALKMDASLSQARDRIGALSGSVPSQEDYFFRGHKSGQSLPLAGGCYGWIGKTVTVP